MACQQFDIYNTVGPVWPQQSYPASCGPRYGVSQLSDIQQAWTFFEKVEAFDANMRVKLSGTGYKPLPVTSGGNSIWYSIRNQSDLILYNRGKQLHQNLFPRYNWTPQRYLGILNTPLQNVYPSLLVSVGLNQ